MPLPFPRVTNAQLSKKERDFVRLTLRATVAYRKKKDHAAQALDSAAHRIGNASSNAHAVYHNFYTMWRDSGFSDEMLKMLFSFLG